MENGLNENTRIRVKITRKSGDMQGFYDMLSEIKEGGLNEYLIAPESHLQELAA